MRKAFAIVAALSVAALVGGSASAGGSGGEIKNYIGVIGDYNAICDTQAVLEAGLGGNCFNPPIAQGTTGPSVSVEVRDSVNTANVGFQLGWYDVDGRRVGPFVPGCNNGVFDVPAGSVLLKVFVDGPINGPADCAVSLPEGIGVQGEIEVAWF